MTKYCSLLANSHRHLTLQVRERWRHLITILVVILVLMLVGAFPAWPHSRNWGYRPMGGLGLVLVIVVILALLGYV